MVTHPDPAKGWNLDSQHGLFPNLYLHKRTSTIFKVMFYNLFETIFLFFLFFSARSMAFLASVSINFDFLSEKETSKVQSTLVR